MAQSRSRCHAAIESDFVGATLVVARHAGRHKTGPYEQGI